jgi:hypothetical protein
VVDHEPRAGQSPADHRQEVDEERRLAGHRRRRTGFGELVRPDAGRGATEGVVHLAVVAGHGECQPALQLGHGQHGLPVAVVGSALGGVGERRSGQLVHQRHHRADQPLDDPAEMR